MCPFYGVRLFHYKLIVLYNPLMLHLSNNTFVQNEISHHKTEKSHPIFHIYTISDVLILITIGLVRRLRIDVETCCYKVTVEFSDK